MASLEAPSSSTHQPSAADDARVIHHDDSSDSAAALLVPSNSSGSADSAAAQNRRSNAIDCADDACEGNARQTDGKSASPPTRWGNGSFDGLFDLLDDPLPGVADHPVEKNDDQNSNASPPTQWGNGSFDGLFDRLDDPLPGVADHDDDDNSPGVATTNSSSSLEDRSPTSGEEGAACAPLVSDDTTPITLPSSEEGTPGTGGAENDANAPTDGGHIDDATTTSPLLPSSEDNQPLMVAAADEGQQHQENQQMPTELMNEDTFGDSNALNTSGKKRPRCQEEDESANKENNVPQNSLSPKKNTVGRADTGEAKGKSKRTTTLDQPPPRTKSARKKRKSSDLSTDHHPKEAEEGLCGGRKRPRTAIQFFVPAFDHDENGGYRDRKHFGLIEGMGGGEG